MEAHEGGDEIIVSIHAPRGGSDVLKMRFPFALEHVSIHAPRGGSDRRRSRRLRSPRAFQSTLPVGGATNNTTTLLQIFEFQSTLPVGGATAIYSMLTE